jgi:hypothetical protein
MDLDPDPTQDQTSFFSNFSAKKIIFSIFLSYNLSTGTLSSVLEI